MNQLLEILELDVNDIIFIPFLKKITDILIAITSALFL